MRCWCARSAGFLIATLLAAPAYAAMSLAVVLPPLTVDPANASAFATPLAYRDGVVYTVNVEPGDDSDTDVGLHTVVRRGARDSDGHWRWRSHLLDAHTVDDPYHTEASIALDKRGYVHVVYNMHYLPWQYSVSRQPDSIAAFEFRGQHVPPQERDSALRGKVGFPGPGTAAIPGNQITYPAFFSDRDGELYVTYRYAVKPKRGWYERLFAGAIARYDVETRRWQQLGEAVRQSRADVALPEGVASAMTHPFAMQPGWWVYQIRLAFDRDNGMHATWMWRKGNAGPDSTRPSYAYSPDTGAHFYRSDGSRYALPITLDNVELITPKALAERAPDGFYNPASVAVSAGGNPRMSVQTIGGRRYAVRLGADGRWHGPDKVSYDARQTVFDSKGYQWAFATGLIVLRRRVNAAGAPESDWHNVYSGGGLCHPRVQWAEHERAFYVHANILDDGDCRDDRVTIVRLSGSP